MEDSESGRGEENAAGATSKDQGGGGCLEGQRCLRERDGVEAKFCRLSYLSLPLSLGHSLS